MNHIHRLQNDLADARTAQDRLRESLNGFRAYLASSKFQGIEADGSRKDWISTAEVEQFLSDLLQFT